MIKQGKDRETYAKQLGTPSVKSWMIDRPRQSDCVWRCYRSVTGICRHFAGRGQMLSSTDSDCLSHELLSAVYTTGRGTNMETIRARYKATRGEEPHAVREEGPPERQKTCCARIHQSRTAEVDQR
jgi:hypothetical protein